MRGERLGGFGGPISGFCLRAGADDAAECVVYDRDISYGLGDFCMRG